MVSKLTKVVPVRVDPESWERFCFACVKYGKSPGDVLRELIEHVDAAVTAIQSQQLVMLNGDLANFFLRRFPNMQAWQWQLFADTCNEIADMISGRKSEVKPEGSQIELPGVAKALNGEG